MVGLCGNRQVEFSFVLLIKLTDVLFGIFLDLPLLTLKYELNSYKQQKQMKSVWRKAHVVWLEELQLAANEQEIGD